HVFLDTFDADMNMHALHGIYPLYRGQRLVSDALHHGFKISRTLWGKRSPLTTAADRSNGRTRMSSRDSLPLTADGLSIIRSSSTSSGMSASICSRVFARSSTKSPSCLRLRTI